MAYTYEQYLKDQEGETEKPSNGYTYDQYVADQEQESKIKDWLKAQSRENAPITTQIKKRYNRYVSTPGIKPEDVDTELTGTEKFAQTLGPAVATTARMGAAVPGAASKLYAGAGSITDLLAKMSTGGVPRLEGNAVADYLYQKSQEGKELSEQMAAPAKEFATTPAERVIQDLGQIGMELALEMPAISRAGLPLYSGLTSSGEAAAAGGDPNLAGISGVVHGAGTHGLFGLAGQVPNTIGAKAAAATAMGGITAAQGGSQEDVIREALLAGILTNRTPESGLTAKQREALKNADREAQWRLEQKRIQERAAELAELQKQAEIEFGERKPTKLEEVPGPRVIGQGEGDISRKPTLDTSISSKTGVPGEVSGKPEGPNMGGEKPKPKIEITTGKELAEQLPPEFGEGKVAAKVEGGKSAEEGAVAAGTGRSVEARVDKFGNILESGREGDVGRAKLNAANGERLYVLNPQDGKWYDKTVGMGTEISDQALIKSLNESVRPSGEAAPKEITIGDTFGEQFKTGKFKPKEQAPAKPEVIEPQTVPNLHAQKASQKAKEIANTTEELTEIMGEPATHLKMNLAEQGRMASELPPEVARDVALGKRKAPEMKGSDGHFLKEEAVWVAEKNRAIERGDGEYLMELAKNSPVQEQISQAGKSLVLLRRNPHDPVYQIMEINKEAKKTIEKNLGNKKVQEVTTKRVAELERIIAEQTKKIEDYENRKTIRELRYEARKSGRKLNQAQLRTEFDDLAKILNKQISTQMNIGLDPKIIRLIGKMTVNRVESGVIKIEQIVDDIYTALGEKLDRRTIRDAITGYGRTSQLTKDEINKELREAKRQGRLISQLEDAEKGLAPLRSGLQRDKPSERVKELRRQVEEAMRKNGLLIEKELKEKKKRIPPTEEERQLTAIEKYKNYIKKRTAELEERLLTGDYSVKPRKVTPIDPILQNKKDHVSRLAKEYNKLKELNELRANGVTKEEAAEIIERSKIVSEKKAAVTDWSDRSVNGAAMEYGRVLYDFHEYANGLKQRAKKITMAEWRSKMTHGELLKSIGHGMSVASGMSKSMLSSMDNSALGRQGIKVFWNSVFKRDGVWLKNAKKSFVDLFSTKQSGREAMREIMADVLSRPNAINGTYGKMKLDIGNVEEAYPEQAPERIPLYGKAYKRTEAAFVGFQYRTRADVADIYLKIAEGYGNKSGVDMTSKEQLESIGRLVNTLTGRGHLGKSMERAAGALNNVFFAPKFFKSNWDFLTMHLMTGDTPFVKQQAALNMVRFVAGTAAVMSVASALGADIELDPRSTDFGKIRVGKTRFDITGGVASVFTLAVRLLGAIGSGLGKQATAHTAKKIGVELPWDEKPLKTTKSSTTGKLSALTGGGNYARTGLDVFVDAVGGKLAPLASLFKQGLIGADLDRKPLSIDSIVLNAILPIGIQNLWQSARTVEDKKLIAAAFLADFTGIGTSTYGKDKKKTVWKKFN